MAAIAGVNPVSTANTPAIVTTAGVVIAASVKRRGFMIQNVGTNPVFILLGTGASSSVFHAVIKGGTGDSDGNGGSYSQTFGSVFQGAVSMAGTTPKIVVTIL